MRTLRIVTHNLQTQKRVFAWTSLSDCGRSTSDEMQEQHHDPDDQHDVNEAAGNVKGQEPKQPKNDQNRCDYSKHVFNSFYHRACQSRTYWLARHGCLLLVAFVLVA